MNASDFLSVLDSDFYTGVPDSALKGLCDCLVEKYGIDSQHHIIAANEGGCTALAAGYHLATGKVPVVYMQNSGIGNAVNPIVSLLDREVYGIPVLFIVGWRGEPGVHDEPQHIMQGKITLQLLKDIGLEVYIVDEDTSLDELKEKIREYKKIFSDGRSAALVIKKGVLKYELKKKYSNDNEMKREDIISHITAVSGEDPIISTTGKASRELFEIREKMNMQHGCDFLTVGSMGHSSSIAMAVASQKPEKKIWCIDGDGAALMHMGALAIIGSSGIHNMVHIVINNGAHESVGKMPTVANNIDIVKIADACGYEMVFKVRNYEELDKAIQFAAKENKLTFIEAMSDVGARPDLGRPTTSAIENKIAFMNQVGIG